MNAAKLFGIVAAGLLTTAGCVVHEYDYDHEHHHDRDWHHDEYGQYRPDHDAQAAFDQTTSCRDGVGNQDVDRAQSTCPDLSKRN